MAPKKTAPRKTAAKKPAAAKRSPATFAAALRSCGSRRRGPPSVRRRRPTWSSETGIPCCVVNRRPTSDATWWVSPPLPTAVEQTHIVDAFVFELSKCEQPGIRGRMVANLRNVDDEFAQRVADGLRLDPLPEPSVPARQPIADLPPSPALSIIANGPDSFAGRKIGALITDGTDADLLASLREAATAEGALVELVAPQVGGVVTSDGGLVPAHQKIDGGPSVLYDAVAILATADGAALLANDAAAKDFVSDAHTHCKYIGYTPAAQAFLEAVVDIDDGYVTLDGKTEVVTFLERCRTLRYWDRTPTVDQT